MQPGNKFKAQSCTGKLSRYWRKLFKSDPPWQGECLKHDLHYWIGGSAADRHYADVMLFRGVRDHGYFIIAVILYIAIRIGGHPSLPFAWHWGYGHDHADHHRKYYDRNQDTYKIIKKVCEEANISYVEIFGDTHHD